MKALMTHSRWAAAVCMFLVFSLAASTAQAQDMAENREQPDAAPSAALQPVSPSTFSFGVRAGTALTDFYADQAISTESRLNPGVGAFVKVGLGSRLAVQPEVNYKRWSGRVNHRNVIQGAQDARYKMTYAHLPVLLKAYLEEYDGGSFFLMAGPYAAVRLSQSAESNYSTELPQMDLDEAFRKWDYGVDLGLGMEYLMARGSVFFDVRYALGMTNLFTDSDKPDFRRRGFVFSVGVGT